MGSRHEYFVASPGELAGLDLHRSPSVQLPADRVAELPGVDPIVVLPALVSVLTATGVGAAADQPVTVTVDDRLQCIAPLVIEVIQGADGDPEMEWEDAVEQWRRVLGERGQKLSAEALLAVTDVLRRLCTAVDEGRHLYNWVPPVP